MRLPGEAGAALDTDEAAWRLLAAWGVDPGTAELQRRALYTFRAVVAERWRQGRFLLAGDAAHQMPPFAGQGLCAGLRDAANLAWKLDLVLGGAAPEALLDTYASERAPQTAQEISFSVDLGRIICTADPVAAAARDDEMAAAAASSGPVPPPMLPALGPGILLAGDRAAGHLAWQGELTSGSVHGRADDVIGRGWLLFGRDGDPRQHLGPARRSWWSSIGGLGADCSAGGTRLRQVVLRARGRGGRGPAGLRGVRHRLRYGRCRQAAGGARSATRAAVGVRRPDRARRAGH
jgi:3-(3-hydroxy-phenyl)propionate hydroxylase